MDTIENTVTHEVIIKKSRFIVKLFPVFNKEEIEKILEETRKEYRDANHVCYGYKIGALEKCSDDGEPSGTAGLPILNILLQKNLDFILCIVIRYFGGIKLGAGGLIRAYGKCANEGVQKGELVKINEGVQFTFIFPYEQTKQIDFILQEAKITEKIFTEKIKYKVQIEKETYLSLAPKLQEIGTINEIEETLLVKKVL